MKKDMNLDDTNMFESFDEKESNSIFSNLIEYIDGDNKNINPLINIPEPKMKLYGFGGFMSVYFDTKEELNKWIRNHNTKIGNTYVIEYFDKLAGRSDVIRVTHKGDKFPNLFTACDEDGYGIYNYERSIYRGEYIWEYHNGSISDMFSAFRDRGIVFQNDIYKKIDEKNKMILNMFDEDKKYILTKKRNKLNNKS